MRADSSSDRGIGFIAAPDGAAPLADALRARNIEVATGRFGAHMRVQIVNDGPVTFWLQASPSPRS